MLKLTASVTAWPSWSELACCSAPLRPLPQLPRPPPPHNGRFLEQVAIERLCALRFLEQVAVEHPCARARQHQPRWRAAIRPPHSSISAPT